MMATMAAALISCQQKEKKADYSPAVEEEVVVTVTEKSPASYMVYKGTLPAADGPGARYELTLNGAGTNNEDGYSLIITYLEAKAGKNVSYTSRGKKEVMQQKGDGKEERNAYKLIPDNGESPLYFLVVNDTTLRLVNENLQEAASGLNYDLIKVR